ncbi:hypothetical protein F7725_025567 [Dissostichus mawsoni]|uniref:Uncharacterized protein n=1 Tax=Dissostichus mawsoni TaxID=36200 RepID=A0A7J5XC06_DISMA|nr:hypothetical protein F7725_025567 [Dissostichus mawsoni]
MGANGPPETLLFFCCFFKPLSLSDSLLLFVDGKNGAISGVCVCDVCFLSFFLRLSLFVLNHNGTTTERNEKRRTSWQYFSHFSFISPALDFCPATSPLRGATLSGTLFLLKKKKLHKKGEKETTEALSCTSFCKNPQKKAALQREALGGRTALERFQETFIFASV